MFRPRFTVRDATESDSLPRQFFLSQLLAKVPLLLFSEPLRKHRSQICVAKRREKGNISERP